ncbi:MAG: hypothetical protein HY760_07005 [Nitrospirae bacterium]|nr:hypothetical protein [Nitrospirota bacterium]
MGGVFALNLRSIIIYVLVITLTGLPALAPSPHAQTADTTPPIVRHTPPVQVQAGSPVTIHAKIRDAGDIAWVNLWYREKGAASYQKVTMRSMSGGEFEATLPSPAKGIKALEYFIEAVDMAGNEGFDGTRGVPYLLTIKPIAKAEAGRKPWYKNKWVWVGLAVVAGGVAAGQADKDSEKTSSVTVVW